MIQYKAHTNAVDPEIVKAVSRAPLQIHRNNGRPPISKSRKSRTLQSFFIYLNWDRITWGPMPQWPRWGARKCTRGVWPLSQDSWEHSSSTDTHHPHSNTHKLQWKKGRQKNKGMKPLSPFERWKDEEFERARFQEASRYSSRFFRSFFFSSSSLRKETDWRKESSGSLQVVFLSCSFEFFQLLFQLLSFMIEGKFLPSVPFQVQVLSCVPFQALWSSFERSFSSISSSQWIWG